MWNDGRYGQLGASIAVKDNTACVMFSVTQVQAPLKAGEMVVYPLSAPQRQPVGEWVITLFFRTKARAHGTTLTAPDAAPDAARAPLVELPEGW